RRGTSRGPACPRARASAAVRHPLVSRRISRSHESYPKGGRNRSAGLRRLLSWGHSGNQKVRVCNDFRAIISMPCRQRRVNNDAALRELGGKLGDALDRNRIGGGEPTRRKCQRWYHEV